MTFFWTLDDAFEGSELQSSLEIFGAFNKQFTTAGLKLADKITIQLTKDSLGHLEYEINSITDSSRRQCETSYRSPEKV